MDNLTAFIPAAGYGERLRPITDHIPKPLLPILGRPVIDIVLERLSELSPSLYVINLHHKGEQLARWADGSPHAAKIRLLPEEAILGTGGGIRNAAAYIGSAHCIVHNADIITDIDIKLLLHAHISSGNIATLALHDHSSYNNVWVDNHGRLQHVGNKGSSSLLCKAFMGVAIYSPAFISYLPEGPSGVVDAWLAAIRKGETIGSLDFSGSRWADIGTPSSYAAAVFEALRREGKFVHIDRSADCCNGDIMGRVVMEADSYAGDGASIADSILLPGAHIASGGRLTAAIAGADFTVPLNPEELLRPEPISSPIFQAAGIAPEEVRAFPIGTGGSDRIYHRIFGNARTVVLMSCGSKDEDFERHLAFSTYFRGQGLPVPHMITADQDLKQALFEDVGDLSLHAWLTCARTPERIAAMYKKVLDSVVLLHTKVTMQASDCPELLQRAFDMQHLLWETGYFTERYVREVRNIALNEPETLAREFTRLAQRASSYHRVVLHRDLQSQNIMIDRNKEPRLIDFQGARLGPHAYDIASLLWDPYHLLPDDMRMQLLDYYLMRMVQADATFSIEDFMSSLIPCRLQRHMQALGAYGFLSTAKGKTYFLRHADQALAYLAEEAAASQADYPALQELVSLLI